MKNAPSFALALALSALFTSTLVVARPLQDPEQAPPPDSTAAPAQAPADDPDTGTFTRMCSDCHDSSRITGMRRTKPEWEDVLHKMIDQGAVGSEKDFQTVFGYLVRNYGKTYINSAASDEIATILGFTAKDADAVVAYRKANGPFADFDAVKKVPGLDLKKLDDRRDAIAF